MKKKTLITLAAVLALGGASIARATLYSQSPGAWDATGGASIWNTASDGTGTQTDAPFSSTAGTGENVQVRHAVTVGNSDVSARDLNLRDAGGSINFTGTGNVYLNWDVNLGVNGLDTSSGYIFNFPGRQLRLWDAVGGAWTHNGDLDIGTADLLNRTGGIGATVNGTGTLSVNQVILNNAANNVFNIDRNLVADDLVFSGNQETINLLGGTFQVDLSLTALSALNLVNFADSDAWFLVESTALSVGDATTAIGAGFITNGTGGGTLSAVADGGYTRIGFNAVIPEPSTLALFGFGLLGLTWIRRMMQG